jgi:hypothetical protein
VAYYSSKGWNPRQRLPLDSNKSLLSECHQDPPITHHMSKNSFIYSFMFLHMMSNITVKAQKLLCFTEQVIKICGLKCRTYAYICKLISLTDSSTECRQNSHQYTSDWMYTRNLSNICTTKHTQMWERSMTMKQTHSVQAIFCSHQHTANESLLKVSFFFCSI